LAQVLAKLPRELHPDVLVGIETSDDAGVFRISDDLALVQTMDFFTPIVDDPYSYGAIAAANALSDIYAMGGQPLTTLNIVCCDPSAAPAEIWAEVLRGMAEKTKEAGAINLGGHSVEDDEPKFGMAVTGTVNPNQILDNRGAKIGDQIWLTKPLGTGILTTAAKNDLAEPEEIERAIAVMSTLNDKARDAALAVDARCATDITGFGLIGHLNNVAKGSQVGIEIHAQQLPILPGTERLIGLGAVTGGGSRNRAHLGDQLEIENDVPRWMHDLVADPQTSGGLAIFSPREVSGATQIGEVIAGPPRITVRNR